MFIGHFALGFAAKKIAPKQNLAWLITAPVWFDVLWPILVALGVERFHIEPGAMVMQPMVFDWYPWSHSLLMGMVWGALLGGVVWRFTGDRTGALVVGALVVSHWFLDVVTHGPDMPLWPGGPRYGLGLWNSAAGTVIAEFALYVVGVGMYLRTTRARDKIGVIALWALVLLMAVGFLAGSFGPPPPNQGAVIYPAIVLTLLTPPWTWWIDAHRERR